MQQPTTEQANRSFTETVNIGETIERFGPRNQQLINFVDKKNRQLWQRQPYQHEYALTKMFLGFNERSKSMYHPDEVRDVINIFQWIKDLKPEQFPEQEKIKGRPDPLFISYNDKLILEHRLKRLNEKNFLQQPESMDWLNGILRIYVEKLTEAGIINKEAHILPEQEKAAI